MHGTNKEMMQAGWFWFGLVFLCCFLFVCLLVLLLLLLLLFNWGGGGFSCNIDCSLYIFESLACDFYFCLFDSIYHLIIYGVYHCRWSQQREAWQSNLRGDVTFYNTNKVSQTRKQLDLSRYRLTNVIVGVWHVFLLIWKPPSRDTVWPDFITDITKMYSTKWRTSLLACLKTDLACI